MNRLTNNELAGALEDGYFVSIDRKNAPVPTVEDIYIKLSKYEKIEEELGIDLITFFKALKNGIWIKEKTSIQFIEPESLRLTAELSYNITSKERLFYGIKICTKRNGFNTACFNYGKTWALTKEELEKC